MRRRPYPTLVSLPTGPLPDRSATSSGLYVDEVFAEIASLPPEEREEALAERCAGYPSIEAEVRALLHAEDEDTDGEAVAIGRGAVLGRYRLEEPLGAGATASVWKAWDTQLTSYTALKLLHADRQAEGAAALDAVLREARAASGVISDHVVRIKTAGRFEGGGPAFVEMELCAEYAPGPDGVEVLETGRTLADAELVEVDEIVRVMAEAARGVESAHRAGVLHRDLKPGNILLTPQSRRAKVTDFGLAADQVFPAPTESTPPTATVTVLLEARDGRIVGTPAFMAPEQALGHPPTRAVDVYALGATLYSLLVGEAPYIASGKHAIPALDVLAQVRKGPPPPLRSRTHVPKRLERIVAKAMARSPRDRYRTAADLARDLELWRANHVTSVDGRAPLVRPALFVLRHRALVGATSTLLTALLVFALAVAWLDLTRRSLEHAIGEERERLELAQSATTEAEHLRDVAEEERASAAADAAAAREARERALAGESQAEARSREEIALRKAAESARGAAEASRDAAEAAAEASRTERDVAVGERERAMAEARVSRESARTAEQARAEEATARREAEDELRSVRMDLVEAEGRAADLQAELARTRAALDAALSAGLEPTP
ncbi:MAG: protein kinase [Myxococcales bacterium]|nr:protein kinase [Myxococcales bacterium]